MSDVEKPDWPELDFMKPEQWVQRFVGDAFNVGYGKGRIAGLTEAAESMERLAANYRRLEIPRLAESCDGFAASLRGRISELESPPQETR